MTDSGEDPDPGRDVGDGGDGGETGDADRRDRTDAASAKSRARRRRIAEVFGDDLPGQTRDDVDDPGEAAGRRARAEAWLRDQVPPHHG